MRIVRKLRFVLNLPALREHLFTGAIGSENASRMDDGKVTRQDPFQIRKADATDANGIADCLTAAFVPHRNQYTAAAYADTVLNHEGVLRRLQDMCLFVAVSKGQIVGTVSCVGNGLEGHLRGMAVLPDWHGTGVAAALLGAAEAEIKRNGCSLITLDTTEPLVKAIRFYRKHGYSASGRVTDFFGMRLFEYRKVLH